MTSSTSAPHFPIIQLKLVQEVEELHQPSEFYGGGLLEKGLFGNWRLWCYFPEAGEWSQHSTQLQSVANTTDSSRVGWTNTKDKSRVVGTEHTSVPGQRTKHSWQRAWKRGVWWQRFHVRRSVVSEVSCQDKCCVRGLLSGRNVMSGVGCRVWM